MRLKQILKNKKITSQFAYEIFYIFLTFLREKDLTVGAE